MKNWVDDQIEKWIKWKADVGCHTMKIIPEEIQVGKILEHFRDVDTSLSFCDMQIEADGLILSGDGYWPRVREILMVYKTGIIIEGSYDDTYRY